MKIKKEIVLYFSWGIVVSFANFFSLWFFSYVVNLNELISNCIAWIITNYVSFITNRISVFHAETNGVIDYLKQLGSFYLTRIVTLIMEEIILLIFVSFIGLPVLETKIVASILVVIVNYFISCKYVFNNTAIE